MNQLQQLEQDLRYVRGAVERAETNPSSRRLCFLWAVVGGAGFALVDLRVDWVPSYWIVAGPGGFLASAYLGWRHAAHAGQPSPAAGYLVVLFVTAYTWLTLGVLFATALVLLGLRSSRHEATA